MSRFTPIRIADAQPVDELREAPRKRVLMQATIICVGGSQRVSVKDLTSSGARVHCDRRLGTGGR